MKFDVIIIGAGAAGMATCALLQKRRPDLKVALLEAHNLPGGCASYFERQGYVFDAGATTLSAFGKNQPMSQLQHELNLPLEMKKIDPGMISILDGKSIARHAKREMWLAELQNHFPEIDHHTIWNHFFKAHDLGWSLHAHFDTVPLRDVGQMASLLGQSSRFNPINSLRALRSLTKSAKSALKSSQNIGPHYLSLLNEMLFITAQNNLDDTPLLLAAMGLCYPEDTYSPYGGMKAFSHCLLEACQNVYLRHKVTSIEKKQQEYMITTNKSQFQAKVIISTLPYQNHDVLFNHTFPPLDNRETIEQDCWSAFTLYFTLPEDISRASLYYQIHTKNPIPHCGTHSFFASFSIPGDTKRTPLNSHRQCVTISTHTKNQNWASLEKEDYYKKKNETAEFILNELSKALSIDRNSIDHLLTGSPKTFERFTNRHLGNVGGRPHSLRRSLLEQVFQPTIMDNFYLIGDNQFPGQGIAAVVSGAKSLATHLEKNL